MPFTPFHFGVGLAAKAALNGRFLLGFFVALQVVTDLESLYNLATQRRPVHRFLHTFLGAAILAVVASTLVLAVVTAVKRREQVADADRPDRSTPRLFGFLLANALFATWSHVLLDGVMHGDARPFRPISDSNPLLSLVGVGPLHLGCLALGFFGLIGLAFQWSLREQDE